ncbi:hypothetical protein LWI29_003152 [Acer saccharum]|uniref:Uncharacterized protein n=1 Tax=Acer saccharum TaxID=4024 RepID=A0AA39TI60_ACESA|nr:hypothetical protein LWI29_003152 [Acer saccharum]
MVHEGSKTSVEVKTPSKKKNKSLRSGWLATLSIASGSLGKLIVLDRGEKEKERKQNAYACLVSSGRVGLAASVVDSLSPLRINCAAGPSSPREEIDEGISLGRDNVPVRGNSTSTGPLANPTEVEPLPIHLEMVGEYAAPMFYAQNEDTSSFLEDFDMGPYVGYHYVLFDRERDDGKQPVNARHVNMLASSPIGGDNSARLPNDASVEQNQLI